MHEGQKPRHKSEFVVTVVFAFISCLVVGVLTFLWLSGTVVGDVYDNSVSDLLQEPLEAFPDEWSFILLYVIIAYQFIWLVYALSTLCTSSHGGYLYLCPQFIPIWLYVVYIVGLALFIAHIFLWDNDKSSASLILVALAFVAFCCSAAMSYISLDKNRRSLEKRGLNRDITFVQVLVQNGLEMMLTWTGIMSLMLIAEVIYVREEMSAEDASTVALGIVAGSVLLLGLFGFFVFERYQRYTFAPYLVFGVYLAGVLSRHWQYRWPDTNLILALVTLIVLFLFFIVKLSLTCVRGNICGRYCGCEPSCHCTGASCCDCDSVNEDSQKDTTTPPVVWQDVAPPYTPSSPAREVLNQSRPFSQPYQAPDTYGLSYMSPPLGGASYAASPSMSTSIAGLSQPRQHINSLTVSGTPGHVSTCGFQAPVAPPPAVTCHPPVATSHGHCCSGHTQSFPRPASTCCHGHAASCACGRNY